MFLPARWICWLWILMLSCCGVGGDEEGDFRTIPLRTHSLNPPYLDGMRSRWFDFGGDTVIRTDQFVRLTPSKASRAGWLFSRVPLTATNWEIEVEFKIHGAGNLYGDGMAMWITKQPGKQGDVFGFVNKFEGLGIFIDTYKNNRPGTVFPYVMAMLGDGNTRYEKHNDGKSNELAGCSARGIRNQAFPTKLRLTYFQEKSLVLELQYKGEDSWTNCFSVENVKVPSVSYLGFSAETGELNENHDIISVNTRNLYARNKTKGPAYTGDRQTKRKNGIYKKKTSWSWFFFKVVIACIILSAAYFAFTVYRVRRSSRF